VLVRARFKVQLAFRLNKANGIASTGPVLLGGRGESEGEGHRRSSAGRTIPRRQQPEDWLENPGSECAKIEGAGQITAKNLPAAMGL